jgi:hypothetical protein
MNIPRRTLNEVKARLRLEPTIREIYVEGSFDRDIYRWALEHLAISQVKVYPVSIVEIDSSIREKYNLTSGERQRVLALAYEMESGEDFKNQILCILDADYDYVLETPNTSTLIKRTTGTAAEMHFWDINVFIKFCRSVLGVETPEENATRLMEKILPIVGAVFLLRAANESLKLGWSVISLEDAIDRHKVFNFEAYYEKVANKNGAPQELRQRVKDEITRLIPISIPLDARKKIHGHDLTSAIKKILTNDGVKRHFLTNTEELGRIFFGLLEWKYVESDPLYAELKQFGSQ